jgi:hypothetical protein
MKVKLAYAYGNNGPGEEVDLDDAEAQRLIRDGLASDPSKQDEAKDDQKSGEA